MLFKIALSNVKKSFKDYTIYFLTLTFAVCIFYSFNSIESQNSMLEMGSSTSSFIATLNTLIAGASVFVAVVLGGLIAYANNFLIRRRKKELAIYMTLGMSKSRISRILVLETSLIGMLALAAGSLLGVVVSQGLSIVTAKLLAINISRYEFTISATALIKTAIYFGIIFLLVMILNQITIRKYKLINLLNAARKNETVKLKHPALSVLLFIISITMLFTAYRLVIQVGLNTENNLFFLSILLGIAGTLLFFFSLSNFFILAVQLNRKLYFKNLNIFILRQINNKINTNFLSMSVICLMIFLTVTLLFTMFSFKGSYDKLIQGNTSFDASFQLYINEEDQPITHIQDYMEHVNFQYKSDERHVFFSEYKTALTLHDLLQDSWTQDEEADFSENYLDGTLSAISLSEYNEILSLNEQPPIDLGDDEIYIVSNYEEINTALKRFMQNHDSIDIEGSTYSLKNEQAVNENVVTTATYLSFFYLIVPDNFSGTLDLFATASNVMFAANSTTASEERYANFLDTISDNMYVEGRFIPVFGQTIESVHVRIHGSTTMVVFLGVYLGIVFLVSSAAVLALQQLSDISDSLDRYKSLRKIGVSEKSIDQAILAQNMIYFLLPLALAVIHSIVGMMVINDLFSAYNSSLIGRSSLMIALVLMVIYGAYFYATYLSSRNMVRNKRW